MTRGLIIDSPLEDAVVRWWFCKCGCEYPEHLYFKSGIGNKSIFVIVGGRG